MYQQQQWTYQVCDLLNLYLLVVYLHRLVVEIANANCQYISSTRLLMQNLSKLLVGTHLLCPSWLLVHFYYQSVLVYISSKVLVGAHLVGHTPSRSIATASTFLLLDYTCVESKQTTSRCTPSRSHTYQVEYLVDPLLIQVHFYQSIPRQNSC